MSTPGVAALTHAPGSGFFAASTSTRTKWTPTVAAATHSAPTRSSLCCPAQTPKRRASSWCSRYTCSAAVRAAHGAVGTRDTAPRREDKAPLQHHPHHLSRCWLAVPGSPCPSTRHGLEEPSHEAYQGTQGKGGCQAGAADPDQAQQAGITWWPPGHTCQSSTQPPKLWRWLPVPPRTGPQKQPEQLVPGQGQRKSKNPK